jgi:hypothetical protein
VTHRYSLPTETTPSTVEPRPLHGFRPSRTTTLRGKLAHGADPSPVTLDPHGAPGGCRLGSGPRPGRERGDPSMHGSGPENDFKPESCQRDMRKDPSRWGPGPSVSAVIRWLRASDRLRS